MKFDSSMYFITDSTNYSEEEFLYRVEQALMGGITLLQLREKDKSTREYMDLAEKAAEGCLYRSLFGSGRADNVEAREDAEKDGIKKRSKTIGWCLPIFSHPVVLGGTIDDREV